MANINTYDALIIGGGPSGLTAGICLATAGRSVAVLERASSTPRGPGETLHPGLEAIFEALEVKESFLEEVGERHWGIIVERDERTEEVPYGPGWLGFQIRRERLNTILENRLRILGGIIQYGSRATKLTMDSNLHVVETKDAIFRGRWLFDASGMVGWLDRRTGKKLISKSGRIWLRYGYSKTVQSDLVAPRLTIQKDSWTWRAAIGDGETACVDCSLCPPETRDANMIGADGTWRVSEAPARKFQFRIGDSAGRLDPSCGHGVLRAMMSAMMSVHLAVAVDDGKTTAQTVVKAYNEWIHHWHARDLSNLAELIPMR